MTLNFIDGLFWAHVPRQHCVPDRFFARRHDRKEGKTAAIACLDIQGNGFGARVSVVSEKFREGFDSSASEQCRQWRLLAELLMDLGEQASGQ